MRRGLFAPSSDTVITMKVSALTHVAVGRRVPAVCTMCVGCKILRSVFFLLVCAVCLLSFIRNGHPVVPFAIVRPLASSRTGACPGGR